MVFNILSVEGRCLYLLLFFGNLFVLSTCSRSEGPVPLESRRLSRPTADLVAAPSIAVANYKDQSIVPRPTATSSNKRYGYPYQVAPTLVPLTRRVDEDDEDADAQPQMVSVSKSKLYGNRVPAGNVGTGALKKNAQKKHKEVPYAERRAGYNDERKVFRAYKEPKYRNFHELETVFMPRRMDINGAYAPYISPASPRDPYLSPSRKQSGAFYQPSPKLKTYSRYNSRGHTEPAYGAGNYDPRNYHASYDRPSSNYPSASGSPYNYEEDYTIESNQPITGDIRKRLLQYAGASDMYDGEPDYLRQLARNKFKYGNIGNDYYSYSEPYRGSYRDFPYVESKIRVVKKSRV